MKVLNGEDRLGDVQPSEIDRQSAGVLQQRRAITALHVLHQHAQMVLKNYHHYTKYRMKARACLCFEAAVKGDDKRVVGEGENVALGVHLVDLVTQHQRLLAHLLQGEPLTRLPVPHQVHRAVRAVADQL